MMQVQNLESVENRVSLAAYGQVLRFNAEGPAFPGGNATGWDWAHSFHNIYHHWQKDSE